MTTITIEIPDNKRTSILALIKEAGGNVLNIGTDDDLSEAEFKLLQESYKEALQIRDGKIEAIPASELWND
ncbi:MAG: hypothetical protein M3O71_26080 [Bacteroidota bacterium]|nr:hypothetical protein [Bacteroidota bacterium]